MELIKQPNFDQLYNESAFTIKGCGGELTEWMTGINKELKERKIGQVETFYTFKGKDMNDYYELTSSNKYPDDLTFLAFPLDNLDVDKLAFYRLAIWAEWFDDIVDNNKRREDRDRREGRSNED